MRAYIFGVFAVVLASFIFAGCASTRFHRPPSGSGLDETAQKMIRAARAFTSVFDIFACEPQPELLGDREDNEAYCLALPGEVYALYFPGGGQVDLKVSKGTQYTLRWFDIENAVFMEAASSAGREGSASITLKSPTADRIWLALVEAD